MRRYFFVVAASVVSAAALSACGGTECTSNADCSGYACEIVAGETEGTCFEVCTTDAQCDTGYVCQIEAGQTEGACFVQTVDDTCSADSQCGAYRCDTATSTCFDACTDGSECGDGFQCDNSACIAITEQPYTFAAITSEVPAGSDDLGNTTPGPDIDAIILTSGTTDIPAASVAGGVNGAFGGDGNPNHASNSVVLGARDVALGAGPVFDCDADLSGYYSMGDSTGFVVVSFGASTEIATGDKLTGYELDESNCDGIPDRAETYAIYIGQDAAEATTAQAVRTGWCLAGTATGGGTGAFTINTDSCN